ncbi:hypothetical protein NEUTE2DRAFT_63126 [Neurospora tetrasperma FGSC 2509]|nr:hypothetical protein NEUTE2DRAFT_63126 [Neurospora tetrasperma FGSC 2509]
MAGLVRLKRLLSRNGMFWRNYSKYGSSSILPRERRCDIVLQALDFLVWEAQPHFSWRFSTQRPDPRTLLECRQIPGSPATLPQQGIRMDPLMRIDSDTSACKHHAG